jgi:glycosyltransferase involved in cell wall biosynthesis
LSDHSECKIDVLERFKIEDSEILDTLQYDDELKSNDYILAKYQRYLIHNNRTKVTNTLFSGESSSWDISEHPIIQDADVINLHWISEFIGTESLQKLADLGKPLIWTLHDERAFTGGCHYTFGCMKYSHTCSECPQISENLSWLPKHNLKSRIKLREIPLTFICPSQWMQSKLRSSIIFNPNIHHSGVIPNSVDLEKFKPLGTRRINSLKKDHDIDKNSVCFLTGSFSLEEDRKGINYIVQALRILSDILNNRKESKKIVLLTYGKGSIPADFIETKHLGFIKCETQIAEFFNICDLFLSMTREDNLPNTIMESLACGTPVISTDVGGISDMVTENYNGRLIERDNAKQMADAILQSIEDEKLLIRWSANARTSAELKFSQKKQAESYLKVFRNLIKSDSNTEEKHPYNIKFGIKSTTSSKRMSASASFPNPKYYQKAFDWFHKK